VAARDHEECSAVAALLAGMHFDVVTRAVCGSELVAAVEGEPPCVVLVGPGDHALDVIKQLRDRGMCPVVGLHDPDEHEFVAQATAAGAHALVSRAQPAQWPAAMERALRHFDEYRGLSEAIARRAVIERAKGILMERRGASHEEAFELLRRHARDHGRKVVDVAQAVADGHRLLPRDRA
jgi:AmiR/NasT family two-component response regulator